MPAVWNPSYVSTIEVAGARSIGHLIAPWLTAGAVVSNFVLCFVNTNLLSITSTTVIMVEIALIGTALVIVWDCGLRLYEVLVPLAAYFLFVMVVRSEFDPKIIRDCLIPIAFFFLGRYFGEAHSADRLVTVLIVVVLGASLFEWAAPDIYAHYFDVIRYYVARGTAIVTTENDLAGGFFNSTRFSSRTLLPFLGDHRVSGIFLEAPSAGNFGTIGFAWVLLRDRYRPWVLLTKSLALAAIIVLADARFGLYFCVIALLIYVVTPSIRPTLLFVAPFVVIFGILAYAGIHADDIWDNTLPGRILLAGNILTSLDLQQVFGLEPSIIKEGVRFASDAVNDSGYAYLLIALGVFGMAGMWALFVYMPIFDLDAWRFKNFVALYYVALLSISASVFTIKTAALLWFLYGTLNNPIRSETEEIPDGLPEKAVA